MPKKTLFDPDARRTVLRRVRHLEPDHTPRWGTMDAPTMVSHCAASLRQGLGELPASDPHPWLSRWPLDWIVIHLLPWPTGVAAPPELLDVSPDDWQGDLDDLTALIERFGRRSPHDDWPTHGLFGDISGKSWGVLQYRHLDHHLRQFGQ